MNGDQKALKCEDKRRQAVEVMDVQVPNNGTWGQFINISFTNTYKPHIYYFMMMDCDHVTHMTYKTMPKIEVDFNIMT